MTTPLWMYDLDRQLDTVITERRNELLLQAYDAILADMEYEIPLWFVMTDSEEDGHDRFATRLPASLTKNQAISVVNALIQTGRLDVPALSETHVEEAILGLYQADEGGYKNEARTLRLYEQIYAGLNACVDADTLQQRRELYGTLTETRFPSLQTLDDKMYRRWVETIDPDDPGGYDIGAFRDEVGEYIDYERQILDLQLGTFLGEKVDSASPKQKPSAVVEIAA